MSSPFRSDSATCYLTYALLFIAVQKHQPPPCLQPDFRTAALPVLFKSADWRTCVVLLKNTALFHFRNAFGRRSGGDLPFTARLRFGSGQVADIISGPSRAISSSCTRSVHRCYDLPDTLLPPERVRVILDCGANVGITALYFAWRYPNARIFCIEPDDQNFELL